MAIGAGFTYLLLQNEGPASDSSAVQNRPLDPSPGPGVTAQSQTSKVQEGVYVAYDEGAVSAAQGTKILFFHAAWCPQCRQLESDIKAGTIPEGVTIFKVDYDNSQKLRQKYGVNLQTTLVKVDDAGNEVKKYVAYDDPTLEALIANLL